LILAGKENLLELFGILVIQTCNKVQCTPRPSSIGSGNSGPLDAADSFINVTANTTLLELRYPRIFQTEVHYLPCFTPYSKTLQQVSVRTDEAYDPQLSTSAPFSPVASSHYILISLSQSLSSRPLLIGLFFTESGNPEVSSLILVGEADPFYPAWMRLVAQFISLPFLQLEPMATTEVLYIKIACS